jgi:hypothetical protein
MGLLHRKKKINWADPNCLRCHGRGEWWSGAGMHMETRPCGWEDIERAQQQRY